MPKVLPKAPEGMKWCNKCGPQPLVNFNKDAKSKDGLGYVCRDCNKAKSKQFYQGNKEYCLSKMKIWASNNPDRRAEISREWEKDNPEKVKENRRRFKENHPGYRTEYLKNYDAEHKEEKAERTRRWAKENPLKRRENEMRRNVLKATTQAEKLDYLAIAQRDNFSCYLCGKQNLENSDMHFDHVLPLSRGGTHTLYNVRLTCAFCNLSKGAKTLEEFTSMRGGIQK